MIWKAAKICYELNLIKLDFGLWRTTKNWREHLPCPDTIAGFNGVNFLIGPLLRRDPPDTARLPQWLRVGPRWDVSTDEHLTALSSILQAFIKPSRLLSVLIWTGYTETCRKFDVLCRLTALEMFVTKLVTSSTRFWLAVAATKSDTSSVYVRSCGCRWRSGRSWALRSRPELTKIDASVCNSDAPASEASRALGSFKGSTSLCSAADCWAHSSA